MLVFCVRLYSFLDTTARRVTDNATTLALRYEHEPKVSIYTVHHLLYELSDFPLSLTAQSLVAHVNKLTKITGEVERGLTGIRENVASVLIGNTVVLQFSVCFVNVSYNVFIITFTGIILLNARGKNHLETVLGTITLASLCEATMSVSHKLVRTGTRDTLNLKGEVDMLKHAMVSVTVQVLHQPEGILRVTVVTDTRNLSDIKLLIRNSRLTLLEQKQYRLSLPCMLKVNHKTILSNTSTNRGIRLPEGTPLIKTA